MPNKKLIYTADFRKILKEKAENYAHGSIQRNMLYAVMQWLDRQPRHDAEPVRHAQWIIVNMRSAYYLRKGFKCSLCDHEKLSKSNYCPNCGAKMDLKLNEEEEQTEQPDSQQTCP